MDRTNQVDRKIENPRAVPQDDKRIGYSESVSKETSRTGHGKKESRRRGDSSVHTPDEFDLQAGEVPAGAHRRPVKRWQAFLPFIIVLVLGPLLAWGAVAFLQSNSGSSASSSSSTTAATTTKNSEQQAQTDAGSSNAPTTASVQATPSESAAEVDPELKNVSISVKNMTKQKGLAAQNAEKLAQAGFTQAKAENGRSKGSGISENTVVYRKDEDQKAAQAVAKALGIEKVISGQKFLKGSLTTPVTVYLVQ